MISQILSYIKNTATAIPLPAIILTAILFILLIIQTIRLHAGNSKIRRDAIKRSRSVIGGQLAEQVAPFLPGFPCNPGDARFIGKPVDFIAFPGISEDDEVHEVLLIEVKTGKSNLSGREREVKRAVAEGRVRYVEYRVGE
ncbi:Holliday junction resolvase-like protein [Treponema bryantii]|uniref:Holliday junction resolvase-like protein n=1 Tax=Treponema bryantii TaxID=163 RepID=UPI0009DC30EF|nr:Holliday junction resolvase-like protein [Treponema bryantii]